MKDEGGRMKSQARAVCAILLFILHPSSFVLSQEAPAATPKPGARLMFVPPPMEGTISMGIYDGTGRLVRALHREEEVQGDAFGKALNGLVTSWDGKNDAGEAMPAGKYFARGYMAGDIGMEGEAMHGNDFITDDDSPRVQRILDVNIDKDGKFNLIAQTPANSFLRLTCDKSGAIIHQEPFEKFAAVNLGDYPPGTVTLPSSPITIRDGKVVSLSYPELKLPPLNHPIHACPARDGGVWIIDSGSNGISEVKQFSGTGEFTRRLAFEPNEPAPVKITASATEDQISLLEQSSSMQRVRVLSLTTGTAGISGPEQQAASTWKVLFSRTITFSDTFDQARPLLKFPDGKPFEPREKIKVALLPNPLAQDQPGSVEICAGIDAEGSFLKTADGLLLKRISDTPGLKWTAIGREPGGKIIVVFQSDGAVIEEYRIARAANMMAFDCGDFDFTPAKP